jgi:hypothetical protein
MDGKVDMKCVVVTPPASLEYLVIYARAQRRNSNGNWVDYTAYRARTARPAVLGRAYTVQWQGICSDGYYRTVAYAVVKGTGAPPLTIPASNNIYGEGQVSC